MPARTSTGVQGEQAPHNMAVLAATNIGENFNVGYFVTRTRVELCCPFESRRITHSELRHITPIHCQSRLQPLHTWQWYCPLLAYLSYFHLFNSAPSFQCVYSLLFLLSLVPPISSVYMFQPSHAHRSSIHAYLPQSMPNAVFRPLIKTLSACICDREHRSSGRHPVTVRSGLARAGGGRGEGAAEATAITSVGADSDDSH